MTAGSFTHDGLGLTPMGLAAHSVAAGGWPVFPVDLAGGMKKPLVKWSQLGAETPPEQVRAWWTKWPTAGIGVPTGERSGVVVIDVDGPHGRASLAAGVVQGSPLPRTLGATTAREDGGEHLYFRHVPGLRNRAGFAPGVDVRGEGGFVVVAPSAVPGEDRAYDWLNGGPGDPECPVPAALPAAWVAALLVPMEAATSGTVVTHTSVPVAEYVRGAMDAELGQLGEAERGGRNDRLNRSAFSLGQLVGGGYLAADAVTAELLAVAVGLGLPAGEARATITSGLMNGQQEPRQVVHDAEARTRADRVSVEVEKLRLRDEAQQVFRAEKADATFTPLRRETLKQALAAPRPADPPELLVGLHRVGYNATITAPFKTGKTTLLGNLVRALADGESFLGRFPVGEAFTGRVGLLNYELTDVDQLQWLEDQGIENADRVALQNLRGEPFSLASERNQQELVDWCLEMDVKVLVLDPHRRAFAGFGEENSNDDVNRFTGVLDEIKKRAGVTDLFLSVHTGRESGSPGSERGRGATAMDDWADQRWLLTKGDGDGRFLRVDGRLPAVHEFSLVFNADTRRLTAGEGNRRTQAADTKREPVLAALEAAGAGGANTAALENALGIKKQGGLSELLKGMVGEGHIDVARGGPGQSNTYYLPRFAAGKTADGAP